MSRSTGKKAVSLLVGLLLCMVFMQTAFAAEDLTKNTDITFAENETIDGTLSTNQIDPSSDYQYIMAGNQVTVAVSFTNNGNDTITLAPKLVPVTNSQNDISESWITISPTNAKVTPGSVQKFSITEKIPVDAEGGYYQGQIAFTNDLVPNSTEYANSMQLSISVQAQPKIELQTSYISDNVENGKEYVYKLNIKNLATKTITIDPKLINYNPGVSQAFGDDAIEFSAPSTLNAGEVANMTLNVQVPENTTGSYNGYIDMNVDGKANDGSQPQLGLSFSIWKQPLTPFIKNFNTNTAAPITIEVSTDVYNSDAGLRCSPKKEKPSFNVGLTRDSSRVDLTFVKSVESGSVSIGGSYPISLLTAGDIYQDSTNHYVETYLVPGAVGSWELSILPKNTNNFGYSITVGDNNSVKKGNGAPKN
jgi:hypothetical protein